MKTLNSQPTTIVDVLVVPTDGGGCYDDQAVLNDSPLPVAERYTTAAVSPGFSRVRQPASALSIGLVLDNQQIVWGDCVGVDQTEGVGQSKILFREAGVATIQQVLVPFLRGRQLLDFRRMAADLDELTESIVIARRVPPPPPPAVQTPPRVSRRDLFLAPIRRVTGETAPDEEPPVTFERIQVERRLHTAIRYGASQALLTAVALNQGCTVTELVADEFECDLVDSSVPLYSPCGADWQAGADAMAARQLEALPYASIEILLISLEMTVFT